MKKIILFIALFASLAMRASANGGFNGNELYFVSSPQSYVGLHGQTFNITSGAYGFLDLSPDKRVDLFSLAMYQYDGPSYWSLQFMTPDGSDFHPGFYLDAQRALFQELGHPGLDLTGDGRGYNQLSGWFKVLEFERGDNGAVSRALIKFNQRGEGYGDDRDSSEYGYLDYRAQIVPEPSVGALLLLLFVTIIGLKLFFPSHCKFHRRF